MTANERRNAILEVLCLRRFETVENLAFEFNVSGRTIRSDILSLSLDYPIYTVQGRGGGIYIAEEFRLGKTYLKSEQQELLEKLLPKLSGKDAEIMKSIIKNFGRNKWKK